MDLRAVRLAARLAVLLVVLRAARLAAARRVILKRACQPVGLVCQQAGSAVAALMAPRAEKRAEKVVPMMASLAADSVAELAATRPAALASFPVVAQVRKNWVKNSINLLVISTRRLAKSSDRSRRLVGIRKDLAMARAAAVVQLVSVSRSPEARAVAAVVVELAELPEAQRAAQKPRPVPLME